MCFLGLFMFFQLHDLLNSSWYDNGDYGLLCCVFWYFVGRLVVRYGI